jgi:hypothetical protein
MRCSLWVFLHLNIVDEETRSESQCLTFPTIGTVSSHGDCVPCPVSSPNSLHVSLFVKNFRCLSLIGFPRRSST